MASSRSPERRAHLKLTAGSPLAEVFLVDHDFALVNRAIGELDCTVEPGIYKLKAKLGDATAERLVVLDGDHAIDLESELDVGSPAPLKGAAHTGKLDMDAARAESRHVGAREGRGARVFLMTRGWAAESSLAMAPKLTLHRPDGALVAEAAPSEAPGDGIAMTVEVDPGPYFLRWEDGSGVPAEQCIHTVEGWQTQLFVLDESADEAALGRTRVSVHMGRDGFDPTEEQLQITEQARTALADERRVAAEFLNALPEEFTNPMLGLFRAHLMLIARNARRDADEERSSGRRNADRVSAPVTFDQASFDTVVEGLRNLLGADHPDVVALSTQATDAVVQALAPVTAPPMLWRSWVLLIEASNVAPGLVPVSVWRRTLRLLPLRPFLLWSYAKEQEETDDWALSIAQALATAKREPRQQPGDAGPVSNLISAADSEVSEAGGEGIAASDETRRRVSRELLAPRSAIDEVASPPDS